MTEPQPAKSRAWVWWVIGIAALIWVANNSDKHGSTDLNGDPDCYASAPAKYTGDC